MSKPAQISPEIYKHDTEYQKGIKSQPCGDLAAKNGIESINVDCQIHTAAKKPSKLLEEGHKYAMLTFIRETGTKGRHKFGLFLCNCGKQKEINMQSVKRGNTQSCGCYKANLDKLGYLKSNVKYAHIKTMQNPYKEGALAILRKPVREVKKIKTCSECGETKTLKDFRRITGSMSYTPSNYYNTCLECTEKKKERKRLQTEIRLIQRQEDKAARLKVLRELRESLFTPETPANAPEPIVAKPVHEMQPISLTITITTPEEAIRLCQLGYISMDNLQASGAILPQRGSDTFYEMQRMLIEESIEDWFGYSFDDLKRKCRKRNIVFPRMLAMYLLEKYTNSTQRDISKMFNKGDHTSVIHSRNTIIGFMTQMGESYEKKAINNFLSKYNFEHD